MKDEEKAEEIANQIIEAHKAVWEDLWLYGMAAYEVVDGNIRVIDPMSEEAGIVFAKATVEK